jgi:branched-chain amino acid transport system ATP-binding protein
MTDSDHTILRMSDVYANHGQVPVLQGMSLHIRQGEIVVLVGPHGSGKTAALRAIFGLLVVVRGNVVMGELPIHNLPTERLVPLGISYVDEMKLLFPTMTISDNLALGAYHRHRKDGADRIERTRDNVYELFPILKEREKQFAGTLSGGEQQMLAIGRALMSDPKVLLLDCPTLGLAPKLVEKVNKAIANLKRQGVAILLTEQSFQQAIDITDRGYLVDRGKVVMEGTTEELVYLKNNCHSYLVEK